MHLWRISNYKSLEGIGGLKYSGRWHHAGNQVVYLAESPASAILETLVHLPVDTEDLPSTYTLLRVERSPEIVTEDLILPKDSSWKSNIPATQSIGDEWLISGRTPLARVPSVLTPYTFNYLLNPLHPHASKIRIVEALQDRYDLRLLRHLGR